jgi:hypothetical protein
MMNKYQKPIRSMYDEVYDVDWTWEKRERVKEAYADFWSTLPEKLGSTLNLMLL